MVGISIPLSKYKLRAKKVKMLSINTQHTV